MVLAFFICWAPFHAQRLLYVTWTKWEFPSNFHEINEKLFYISGCFYYLSSTVNPILYNVMSAKYRWVLLFLIRFFFIRFKSYDFFVKTIWFFHLIFLVSTCFCTIFYKFNHCVCSTSCIASGAANTVVEFVKNSAKTYRNFKKSDEKTIWFFQKNHMI